MIPNLKKTDGTYTLYVHDKPYLLLSGEIHNSSASTLTYMEECVWPKVRELNMNTLIVPVYWELIEPQQNVFDFSLVQGIIMQARAERMKLVLLWFGSWKNAASTYAPAWVKEDTATYVRSETADGAKTMTLSPFCTATVEADAKAFSRLMQFIRDFDETENTVIMVQVENEVGILYANRDYSGCAEAVFQNPVPENIRRLTGIGSRWNSGHALVNEVFMAYGFSRALNEIAKAGKEVYPLPMYVNAWTVQYPGEPAGHHPSGGPNHLVYDIWKEYGTHIDALAPDIYLPDFKAECGKYHRQDNPLFIPEARRDPVTVANALYAFGHHDALCYAPFGIEDLQEEQAGNAPDIVQEHYMGMDTKNTAYYLAETYRVLSSMKELLHRFRGSGSMDGFLYNGDNYEVLELGGYRMRIAYGKQSAHTPGGGGLILSPEKGVYYIAAMNCRISFLEPVENETGSKIDYRLVEEGQFMGGKWTVRRRLNGDEYWLNFNAELGLRKAEIYTY